MTNLLLPELVSNVKPKDVSAMVKRVNAALKTRADYELMKSPNGSHVELRRVAGMFADSRTVAAFLHVLGADPDLMFNRVRKAGTRSNLKGFRKVRQLIDYTTGRKGTFETVSKALFASTIIAAQKGATWISSQEQELILSNVPVNSLSKEIREAIEEYKHKHMTLEGDSRPQSCQFRTTFNNLNIYDYAREEFDNTDYSLGIMVNMESPVIQYLSHRWNLKG